MLTFTHEAHRILLDIMIAGAQRGTERHAYLMGTRKGDDAIVTDILRPGNPIESAAIAQPDYGAAGVAIQHYLAKGKRLIGEAHSHLGIVGPSGGDRRTLLGIADQFPQFQMVVVSISPDRDPIITAHTAHNGDLIAQDVTVLTQYESLLPIQTREESIAHFGAGSGGVLMLQHEVKLGVGRVTIIDHDTFEKRNLERHLVDQRAIGKNKARYLARFFRRRSTSVLRAIPLQVSPATIPSLDTIINNHSLVVNATGDPLASVILSERCARLSKPCIHAGVFARGAGGMVFLQTPGGPCYSCLYALDLRPQPDDAGTMDTLEQQYGYQPEELAAQLGLWADVNTVAAIATKVLVEFLKRRSTTPNLYVIDNTNISITTASVRPRPDCSCQQEES